MTEIRKKKKYALRLFTALCAFVLLLGVCLFGNVFYQKDRGKVALNASAYASEPITITRYDLKMDVRKNRKIYVNEEITIRVNESGDTFTRSLPLEGDAYEMQSVSASVSGCSYEIYTANDYLNVDFKSPAFLNAGDTCTYYISYIMQIGVDDVKNGMQIDVVGYGWPFSLRNVTAEITFPAPVQTSTLYSGKYGADGNGENVTESWSADRRKLTLFARELSTYYDGANGEIVAKGVSIRFVLPNGALDGFFVTRVFTDDLWWILLVGVVVIALAVVTLWKTRKSREIIPIINVKAPNELDPLRMGKILDGVADNEDVTAMLYYFAEQGYLSIDLSSESNPTLIRKTERLPETAPVYQKTLFNGLFVTGERVPVSALKEKFYAYADKALKQVPPVKQYENKSFFGFIFGGILGGLTALLIPLLLSIFKIGHGYVYAFGGILILPIVGVLVIERIRENYRFKWKKGKLSAFLWLEIGIAVLSVLLFTAFPAKHFTLEGERFFVGIFAFLPVFICANALSRTEKYCETLGQILGFKDFIVVTEEERIRFMLQENPQLYYKILPYAQVLGVTKEWQDKFKGILLQPPTWCENSTFTVFDYMILNGIMRRMAWNMMVRPQPKSGSFAGKSGGGGSFGGFGGGGHGGGGGGWR